MADEPVPGIPEDIDIPHYVRLKKQHGGTVYQSVTKVHVEKRDAQTIYERRNLKIGPGFDLVFTCSAVTGIPAEQRVDCAAVELVVPPVTGFPSAAQLAAAAAKAPKAAAAKAEPAKAAAKKSASRRKAQLEEEEEPAGAEA